MEQSDRHFRNEDEVIKRKEKDSMFTREIPEYFKHH